MFKRLLFLLIVLALLGGGYYGWGRLQSSVKADPPQLVTVKRGFFVHEVLERGSIDSSRNLDIKNSVESRAAGTNIQIVYVIEEGSLVEEGDLLIELESSMLKDNIQSQETSVQAAEVLVVQSQESLRSSEIALEEYKEGVFEQERTAIKNRIFSAQEQVRTLETDLGHYRRLFERGYVMDAHVEAASFELAKANNTLEMEEQNLKVLETLTKEKRIIQLNAAILSDKALVAANKQSLLRRQEHLNYLQDQLERCKITAPRSGQVVYYMPRWGGDENLVREGLRVIERQTLLQLPDPTQMQVKGLVNEANVRLVKPGQRANIRLEAFPNQVFEGVVRTVNDQPEPGSFFGASMSKEYLTTVMVLNPPEGIKTGMTAEAKIVVNEIPDALLLPTQAVFEYGKKMYVVSYRDGKWDKIEVKTGPANDKEVVILEGLKEDDVVVLGAWAHRDKISLPKIEQEPRRNGEDEQAHQERIDEWQRSSGMSPGGSPGNGESRPSREGRGGGGSGRGGGGPTGAGGGPPSSGGTSEQGTGSGQSVAPSGQGGDSPPSSGSGPSFAPPGQGPRGGGGGGGGPGGGGGGGGGGPRP